MIAKPRTVNVTGTLTLGDEPAPPTPIKPAPDKLRGRAHAAQVLAGDIRVPPYQRPLKPLLVREIADNLDPDKLKLISVSRRADGSYWVIDGNHRLQAILSLGWADQKLDCWVYLGLTYNEEVRLFRAQAASATLKPGDFFRAALEERDPDALAIKAIVEARGFTLSLVGYGKGVREIKSVAALRDVYDDGGQRHLRETLQVLMSAYGDNDEHFYGGNEILGFARFLRWWPEADRERLVAAARRIGTVGLADSVLAQRRITRGTDVATATALALQAAYNVNLRTKRLDAYDAGAMRNAQGHATRRRKSRDEDRMKDAR